MRKLKHYSFFFFLSFCFVALNAQTEEYGMASYYGDEFHGGATASGEAYDKNKLTAAHKTLTMGTRVKVTRLDNKKSVVVRINDRGPYLKGRIIDLSGRAASALDMIIDGTAEVKLEVLGRGSTTSTTQPKVSTVVPKVEVPATRTTEVPRKPASTKKTTPRPASVSSKQPTKANTTSKTVATSQAEENEKTTFEMVTAKNFNEYDLYKIQVLRPEKKGFGVQVASFSEYSNVMRKVAELQGMWFKNILVSVEKGANNQPIYKLILGPFPDQKTATSYKKAAKKNKKIAGFVVSLEDIKADKN